MTGEAKKDNTKETTKLDNLNHTLMGVENDLMRRALDRTHGEVEHAYDFINKAAEDGIIDITCPGGCEDDEKEDNPQDGADT